MFFGCQYNHLFIHRVNNHLLHVKHWEFLGNSSDDFLFLWSPLIIDRLSYISEGYHLDAKPAELVAYPSLEYSERVFCALVLLYTDVLQTIIYLHTGLPLPASHSSSLTW